MAFNVESPQFGKLLGLYGHDAFLFRGFMPECLVFVPLLWQPPTATASAGKAGES